YADDRSAADLALCNLLAFWTGRDATRMDRLFRGSGLMREKWDSRRGETTYGGQTIARAIAACVDVYQPPIAIDLSDEPVPAAVTVPDPSPAVVAAEDGWPHL